MDNKDSGPSKDGKLDRRTKVYKDLVLKMPKNDGTITEIIDGQSFKYMPEPRCRCCTADDPAKNLKNGILVKDLVDRLLLYPMSVAGVLRYIEPYMEEWPEKHRIKAKSIRTHLNKHLPWDQAAMRYMVEKWANQKGIQVLDSAGRMVLTEEAWLEATAQMGWQRMMQGDIEPSWQETQKAFERMQGLQEVAEGTYSTTYLIAQLNKIVEVMRSVVPEEYHQAIFDALEKGDALTPPSALVEASDEVFESIVGEFIEEIEDDEEEIFNPEDEMEEIEESQEIQ